MRGWLWRPSEGGTGSGARAGLPRAAALRAGCPAPSRLAVCPGLAQRGPPRSATHPLPRGEMPLLSFACLPGSRNVALEDLGRPLHGAWGSLLVPISQMRKPRIREVMSFAYGFKASVGPALKARALWPRGYVTASVCRFKAQQFQGMYRLSLLPSSSLHFKNTIAMMLRAGESGRKVIWRPT